MSRESVKNVATAKSRRRSHRKSRNGCLECKHRHVRCDERKPSCANCEAADRTCSFLAPQNEDFRHNRRPRRIAMQQEQQQSKIAAAPWSDLEVSSSSSAPTAENEEPMHTRAQAPIPVLHQQNQQLLLELSQTPDSLFCGSLPKQDYLPPIEGGASTSGISYPPSPIQKSYHQSTPIADCYPALSTVSDTDPKRIFTPDHMVLLHNAAKVPNLIAPNRNTVDIAIRHIIRSPYLMDEVLAFTAFHMAHLHPGSAVSLRNLATELQTRALASFTRFTDLVPTDDKATAVPRFLFSGILGRHVLADTLTHCNSNFDLFIDRFVEGVNLNRGIRAVTPPAWDYLNSTEVRPFLDVVRKAEEKIILPGIECDILSRFMDRSDLNKNTIKACRQAIEVLQECFDLCRGLPEDDYPQSVSVFSVRIEVGFLDVLRKHQPEALVILAYYGVLLYRCRSFWAFRDAGASMIRAIDGRIGSYWQEALAWPLHVLETERNSEPLIAEPDS